MPLTTPGMVIGVTCFFVDADMKAAKERFGLVSGNAAGLESLEALSSLPFPSFGFSFGVSMPEGGRNAMDILEACGLVPSVAAKPSRPGSGSSSETICPTSFC